MDEKKRSAKMQNASLNGNRIKLNFVFQVQNLILFEVPLPVQLLN